jgi:hypothetical protein
MGTQVTLVYTVQALGMVSTKLRPFVASAPIPLDVLQALGLRIISDTTTAGIINPIVRTIVLGFEPSLPALVNPPTITNTSRIQSVTVDVANRGRDFILPPIIRANNNQREPVSQIVEGVVVNKLPLQRDALFKAYMAAYETAIDTGGAGYTAATTRVTWLGGLPPANFNFDSRKVDPTTETSVPRNFRGGCVRYINIADPGEGYDPATAILSIQGGGPGGGEPPLIQAEGILSLDAAGRVRSIQIVNMGSVYESVPDVFITTTDGVGPKRPAKLFAVMAEGRPAQGFVTVGAGPGFPITSIVVTDPGDNYVTVPSILIRDPVGTGATAHARMGLGRIDTIAQGEGYYPGTTFSIIPAFQDFFPTDPADPQAQNEAFFEFLRGTIQQIAITPLSSATPLVA